MAHMFSSLPLLWAHTKLVIQDAGRRRAARFFLRGLWNWGETIDWLSYLEAHAYLKKAPLGVKRVLGDKIHRPFSQCVLSVRNRVTLLKNHYDALESLFSETALKALVSEKRFVLAQIKSKCPDDAFSLTLSREMISQHQGELAILLIDENSGIALARLLLNIVKDDQDKIGILLNGIQGPGPEHKARIVRVTRDLYGLRPKRAVVEAAGALAQWLGQDHMIALAKKNHVSQAKEKWQRKVVADYDDFWMEFDPAILENGNYKIVLPLPRRNIEDVVPKKRKDWQRRCVVEDEISSATRAALDKIKN